ncbi:L,D-transpeptidase family protein [Nocardioides dongxiaopingii]|uniref:L,D-transpeptidase n=1 Tax=Nocardioides sp. S-1144 TaxID=2582905 RepID=UPI0011624BEF|nr:Ig-like domain-containing protein [Nocardioides sp. S-1144]QDH11009.1 L,D-transpeptidase family protein [Nocardioides sp. S-1144]
MSVRLSARVSASALAAVLALSLAACSSDDGGSGEPGPAAGAGGAAAGDPAGDPAQGAAATGDPSESAGVPTVSINVERGATDVPVSTLVEVTAEGGRLDEVTVTSDAGEVAGTLADDGASWTASDRLEPGTAYTVNTRAGEGDATERTRLGFTTVDLSLDEQTFPSVAPLQGETVGVGMPVIVSFDLPVTDKAAFEEHMVVDSKPAQVGSWYWLSDTEAHWRPKSYWSPGTEVTVDVDVNGVDAGNGIYGQENREVAFEVGDAHIYQVDAKTHQMKVFSNGKLLRTLPITTGKPGFTTRSGTKVIMEKFESKRMNSETVGIPQGSSEAYDIDNVQWAMRVTNSGEFIHAAPWSVGSQGQANVSHGCTGMSTSDAGWLYAMSRRGDVVEYTGTDREMTFDNGYGDWNKSFKDYQAGSALA